MPKEAVRSAQPQPSAVVFQDGESERRDFVLLLQLRECVAVVSVQRRSLGGEPHVPGSTFMHAPDLLAFNDSLLREVCKVLSIKPTDSPVNRPEPDVSRLVLKNAADGVVRQAVAFGNVCQGLAIVDVRSSVGAEPHPPFAVHRDAMHELAAGHASGRIGLCFWKCEGGERFSVESADALDGADPHHAARVKGHAPDLAADQAVIDQLVLSESRDLYKDKQLPYTPDELKKIGNAFKTREMTTAGENFAEYTYSIEGEKYTMTLTCEKNGDWKIIRY